jgi:nicotinamidase/pyrazinamidase
MTRALVVVDVQNDFCEGGSLAVAGGSEVARGVDRLLRRDDSASQRRTYAVAVATFDHHIDPGSHFSAEPDFVHSWPPHCVVGTAGEALHPALDPRSFDALFVKGEYEAAYSGFEGREADGRPLAQWLRDHGVDSVDICGIATDYCVRATALDALREGFDTRVLVDLCAGVAPETSAATLAELAALGVELC